MRESSFKKRLEKVYSEFKSKYTFEEVKITDEIEEYRVVGGNEPYTVTFKFDEDGRLVEKTCTCPDFVYRKHRLCKHIIGVLMETGREYMLLAKLIDELRNVR